VEAVLLALIKQKATELAKNPNEYLELNVLYIAIRTSRATTQQCEVFEHKSPLLSAEYCTRFLPTTKVSVIIMLIP